MDEEELPIADAARRLGVDISTLRRRLKRGEHAFRTDGTGRYLVRVPMQTPRRAPRHEEPPDKTPRHGPMQTPGQVDRELYLEVLHQRDFLQQEVQALHHELRLALTSLQALDGREQPVLELTSGELYDNASTESVAEHAKELEVTPGRPSRLARLRDWYRRMDRST